MGGGVSGENKVLVPRRAFKSFFCLLSPSCFHHENNIVEIMVVFSA